MSKLFKEVFVKIFFESCDEGGAHASPILYFVWKENQCKGALKLG
jgi:hypothetical protein